jgi:rhamnosyltransferase
VLDPQSICLAAVTYFPEKSFFERFPALSRRFGGSVIVDNQSPVETIHRLKDLGKGVDVILNPSNLGLGCALNQATRKAVERAFSWVLLLDQDSDLDEGFLQAYGDALAACDSPNRLAVIGNNYSYAVDSDQVPLIPEKDLSHPFVECKAVITAGSLVSLPTYGEIGPFREDFFIDWIDTEYCYRARRKGHKVVMVTRPVVRQNIGNTMEVHSVVGAIRTTNHSAFRRYYMTRNLILLSKEYAFFEPMWFVARFYDVLITTFKILISEKDKKAKIGSMLKGTIDGIIGSRRK